MNNKTSEKFLDMLTELAEEHEAYDYTNISEKIDLINCCYDMLVKYVEGAKVTKYINKPFKNMGYIAVVGKNVKFKTSKIISVVGMAASNIDIYPKLNGDVCIDFTFNGIAKRNK